MLFPPPSDDSPLPCGVAGFLQAKEAAEKAVERTEAAKALVATGKRGAELLAEAKAQADKVLGSFVLREILSPLAAEDAGKLSWVTSKQFGPALKHLLGSSEEEQKEAVYVVQAYSEAQGYPASIGKTGLPLIQVIFTALYNADLVDQRAFYAWRDDEREQGNKRKAVIQTTSWFQMLDDDDDDEEDDELEGVEGLNNI